MPWASIIGGVVSLIDGEAGADASADAAQVQAGASVAQIAEQRRQFDLSRGDQQPFLTTGTAGNRRLSYLLGLGPQTTASGAPSGKNYTYDDFLTYSRGLSQTDRGTQSPEDYANTAFNYYSTGGAPQYYGNDDIVASWIGIPKRTAPAETAAAGAPSEYGSLLRKFGTADMEADPVYKSGLEFGLKTGTDAINARAIQAGGYDSGATLRALTRYGNDYGTTKGNEAYNRYTQDNSNIYNKLAGISGTGQVAASQIQSAGQNMANQVSSSLADAGNARAAGIIGGANSWSNAFGGVNNAYNNYNSNKTLQGLMRPGGYGGYGGGGTYSWDDASWA